MGTIISNPSLSLSAASIITITMDDSLEIRITDNEASTNINAKLDLLPYPKQAAAVDEAVQKAVDLLQEYASAAEDDTKGRDNPWKNPDEIYAQLDRARSDIMQAWDQLHAARAAATAVDEEANSSNSKEDKETCLRMAYMDMITDAFADVLEDLRTKSSSDNNDDPLDVETLVDCLQSGLDLWNSSSSNRQQPGPEQPRGASLLSLHSSYSETDFSFSNINNEEDNNEEEGARSDDDVRLTPHESRRRQLGFLSKSKEETTA